METKQLTVHGFDRFDADDFGQFIMECLHCSNMESADDVYDNLSIFDGGSNEFNLFPNVEIIVAILEISAVEFYIIFGNWIVTHNIPNPVWNLIDKQNLVPYYGHNYKITDFQK